LLQRRTKLMALEDALPGNIPKFGRFDRSQTVFTRTKVIEPVAPGGIAGVNVSTLVPIVGPIGTLSDSTGVFSCGGFGLLSFAGRAILASLN
jgi:hypothetical protein